ncbi:MAG TPA: hypothetical protein VFN70_18245 [Burkholderiales bacterium]|nr:hypothetical protein [Burkholderiales bacterium]
MDDRVLVERIDETDGKERVSAGGIILPPKDMTLKHGRAREIPDTFRARVLAVGPDARHELAEGAEVIVHTYDQRPDQTLAGEQTRYGLLVRLADVLAEVESVEAWQRQVDHIAASVGRAHSSFILQTTRDAMAAEERYSQADYENSPPFTDMRPKTQEWIPKPPESVNDLGFHRKGAK